MYFFGYTILPQDSAYEYFYKLKNTLYSNYDNLAGLKLILKELSL